MAHQGEVLKNPVTGQNLVFRRTTAETAGELLEVESSWAPGGDEQRVLEAGDTLVVPAGTVHAMWNAGEDEARAVWQTRPGLKTEAFFETAWGLVRDGDVNDRGMLGRPTRYPATR